MTKTIVSEELPVGEKFEIHKNTIEGIRVESVSASIGLLWVYIRAKTANCKIDLGDLTIPFQSYHYHVLHPPILSEEVNLSLVNDIFKKCR
ncbi:MAG: hypothetical protein LBG05_10640 [Treponema sp.]|jgi:hypothetical protein|nr:hypothetical protein [Treponema sp.]